MRLALLYNPSLLLERLADLSHARRRRRRLRRTPAHWLTNDHIDSLELLDQLEPLAPRVIYDVGANVGTWTLLAKARFPAAVVHAFEPLDTHHAAFARNTGMLESVHLHRLGLADRSGPASMRVTSFSDASSLLPLTSIGAAQWHIHEVAQAPIEVVRMDDWQESGRYPMPSVIKLDVQGFELNVLRGAERCAAHADALVLEVSFREFYEGQCLFHHLVAYLAERGFQLHALGHGTAVGRPLVAGDALFVAERIRHRLPR